MAAQSKDKMRSGAEDVGREPLHYILAFAVGALVGVGMAAIWASERRGRLPAVVGQRYRRVRDASASALDDARKVSRRAVEDFREELGANVEAAREEFGDLVRDQLDQARSTLRKEYKKLRGKR